MPETMDDPAGPPPAARHAPATARNAAPILSVLADVLPPTGVVLEVASGTGEHAVRFAAALPGLEWQPSDPDPVARASIAAWAGEAGLANLRPPLALDATAAEWPALRADAILCVNMTHISPWAATEGLFRHAAALLGPGAPLLLYGPFLQAGVPTAPGNTAFDDSLRARDPAWGLREVERIRACSADFALDRITPMPADNLMLAFRRLPG